MCRGHQQQPLDEGVRVFPGLCVQVSTVLCMCLEDECLHLCVLGWGRSGSVCHCLCLFQSYQLFLYVCVWGVCIAGRWQCVMLSLVVSEHLCCAAVCASVSLCVHQRL